jgi:hypothetical protein
MSVRERLGHITEPPAGLTPLHFVSSPQLARWLGVSNQTTWNWRVRGYGPRPIDKQMVKPTAGQPTWYRVADVLAWIHGRTAEDVIAEWVGCSGVYAGPVSDSAVAAFTAAWEDIHGKVRGQPRIRRAVAA